MTVFYLKILSIGTVGSLALAGLLFLLLPKQEVMNWRRFLILLGGAAVVLLSAFGWAFNATLSGVRLSGPQGNISFFVWFLPELAVSVIGFVKELQRQKSLRP